MSKTLVDIDEDLLARAQTALGGKVTKKDAVTEGLRRIVAEDALERLGKRIGDMDDADRALMLSWRQ